ncbi:lck-interacting transmembrane adapter 1 [Rhinatrema bivittatum]|uniref:lck-interacting transmembrane adapter 1 n=1 Tax=Rhinatrema bivittatum TaxID=194408 RepID=UPI00112933C2|nr:lck-interacting transmembrane adapter 1 [Rhinatrema bivittatum]
MASPPASSEATAPLLPFAALLGLMLSVTLCVICKRKRMKKKVLIERVQLVDVSLLRQTQLRSLSKSDTKLHELKRVPTREQHQRPASMDFLCTSDSDRAESQVLQHRQLPKIPSCNPLNTEERMYSNLCFTIQPQTNPSVLYESVTEAVAVPVPSTKQQCQPQLDVASEYACVKKGKLRAEIKPPGPHSQRERSEAVSGDSPSQSETPQGREAEAGKVEEMYSVICKKKLHNPAPPPSAKNEHVEIHPEGGGPAPRVLVYPGYRLQRMQAPAASGKSLAGSQSTEPAYQTIDATWKTNRTGNNAATYCPDENFYESIGEVKRAESRASANLKPHSGLEMYETDL